MMDDASDIKAQKLEELKAQASEKQSTQENEAQAQQQIEMLLRQALDHDAKQRLSTIRLVNPQVYWKAAQTVLYVFRQNPQVKISDSQLKSILERLSYKRETTIKRK